MKVQPLKLPEEENAEKSVTRGGGRRERRMKISLEHSSGVTKERRKKKENHVMTQGEFSKFGETHQSKAHHNHIFFF